MSTTNTTGGMAGPSDNPGTTPGAIGGDHPGVDAGALARGHEADNYHTASVVSVPLMVIGFFLAAFAVTTAIFWFFAEPDKNPAAHPAAAARNAAPLSEQLNRIGRGKEIDQPRLEPLVIREEGSQTFTRKPVGDNNPPLIHPEQLRPSKENTPALYEARWVEQGKVARISIDDAMQVATKDGVLKVAKDQTKPVDSRHSPSAANAGRGAEGSKVTAPGAKPKKEEKH